jgi:hypothetical protein
MSDRPENDITRVSDVLEHFKRLPPDMPVEVYRSKDEPGMCYVIRAYDYQKAMREAK